MEHLTLSRRRILRLAAGSAALTFVSRNAEAQAYPSRRVRYIVSAPAGGAQDILARLMGQWLSDRLGQPFIIENRPGGGTNIATELVVRAPGDGYTILSVAATAATNATLYENLSFDFIRDIAPVAGIMRVGLVLLVNRSLPINSLPEYIAYAKANPGKMDFASPGPGTTPHLAGELLKILAGIDILHVPYRGGGPALNDFLGGHVQSFFGPPLEMIEHIKAGKVRPLAVTTSHRMGIMPDVPTLGTFLPDYEASTWFGIGAPRNTSVEIVDKLNKEVNAGLSNPRISATLAELGGEVLSGSPAEFGNLIADETVKWAKVIKRAGVKPN